MKITITAEDIRDYYADYLAKYEGDPDLEGVPTAEDLTAEDLAEMLEAFEWRESWHDNFDPLAALGFVVEEWVEDWKSCHE